MMGYEAMAESPLSSLSLIRVPPSGWGTEPSGLGRHSMRGGGVGRGDGSSTALDYKRSY